MHKNSGKYLGFKVTNELGETEFYLALVMFYGISIATEILTSYIRPIKAFCHKLGILFTIYLDDGRVISSFESECHFKTQTVLLLIQLAGFNINFAKSKLISTKSLHYQGFILNSAELLYLASVDKESNYRARIRILLVLHQKDGKVPCLLAASVLGSVQSLRKSHGSIVNIIPRSSQNELGRQVIKGDWNSNVTFSAGLKEFIFLEIFCLFLMAKQLQTVKIWVILWTETK